MVGHTGNFESAKIAAEAVNDCVKELVAKTKELKGIVIVTADHGNLENMNDFRTSHTLNKVPFIIVDSRFKSNFVINTNIMEPGLGNIAATIINLLGYKKPSNFLSSLIEFRA